MVFKGDIGDILCVAYSDKAYLGTEVIKYIQLTAYNLAGALLKEHPYIPNFLVDKYSDEMKTAFSELNYDPDNDVDIDMHEFDSVVAPILNKAGFDGSVMNNAAQLLMMDIDPVEGTYGKMTMGDLFRFNGYLSRMLKTQSYAISHGNLGLYMWRDYKDDLPSVKLACSSFGQFSLSDLLKLYGDDGIDCRLNFVLKSPDGHELKGYVSGGEAHLDDEWVHKKRQELYLNLNADSDSLIDSFNALLDSDCLVEADTVKSNVDSLIANKKAGFDNWFKEYCSLDGAMIKSLSLSGDAGKSKSLVIEYLGPEMLTIRINDVAGYELYTKMEAGLGIVQ